jgi:autotransporter-associated beta strand protein
VLAIEALESRTLLSGTQIILGPATDMTLMGFNQLLGSSNDMFQPHVSVAVKDAGQSLGPYGLDPSGQDQNNVFLLDSGANDISVVGTVAQQLIDNGLTTVGKFKDLGAGGFATYNLSSPYEVDFTDSNSKTYVLPQTANDVRFLTSTTFSFGAAVPGVLGMPAMLNRVTTLNTSQQQNFGALGVTFSNTLPASSTGHRFTVSTDTRVKFDPHAGLTTGSAADALPTWGDINFVTAKITYHGVTVTGSFVLDTGSQLSMLSHSMAAALGLDLNNPIDTLPIEGVGGTVNVPVMAVDTLGLTTDEGPDLVWKGNSTSPLGLGVLDIAPGVDGVLGSDLLSAGLGFDMSTFDFSGAPYFNTISLDFRNVATQGTGKLVFDLNPQYYKGINTWVGPATGGDWNNAVNWSAGTPSSGSMLLMQSATPATMNNNLGNGYSLGEISTDGSFTLSGNSVVLDATGGVAIASIEGNSTFGLQTQLGSDGTVQVTAGQLAITGGIDTNAHQLTVNVAGGATGRIGGSITNTGGLQKAGSGALTLSGVNSYSGGTTVTAGTLVVANAQAIADGSSLTIGSGSSAFASAATISPAATASPAMAGATAVLSTIAPVSSSAVSSLLPTQMMLPLVRLPQAQRMDRSSEAVAPVQLSQSLAGSTPRLASLPPAATDAVLRAGVSLPIRHAAAYWAAAVAEAATDADSTRDGARSNADWSTQMSVQQ